VQILKQGERRDRELKEPVKKGKWPVALSIDEAYDLNGHTLIGLKQSTEVVSTMDPRSWPRMCLSSCFMHAQMLHRLMAPTRSQSSALWSAMLDEGACMSVLLKAMGRNLRSITPAICASSITLQIMPSPWPQSVAIFPAPVRTFFLIRVGHHDGCFRSCIRVRGCKANAMAGDEGDKAIEIINGLSTARAEFCSNVLFNHTRILGSELPVYRCQLVKLL
jgi:hypothetical protein